MQDSQTSCLFLNEFRGIFSIKCREMQGSREWSVKMNYWVSDKLDQGDVKQEFKDGIWLSWWISLLGLLPFRLGSVGRVSAGALLILADCRLRLPATVSTVIVTVVLLVEWDRSRHRPLLIAQCLASALKFSYTDGLKVSTHKFSEFDYIWIGRILFYFI